MSISVIRCNSFVHQQYILMPGSECNIHIWWSAARVRHFQPRFIIVERCPVVVFSVLRRRPASSSQCSVITLCSYNMPFVTCVLCQFWGWCIMVSGCLSVYVYVTAISDWRPINFWLSCLLQQREWLGSWVVSVLDSGTVGPGFKLQPRCCRVTVLGKLFKPIVPLFTKPQNW